MAKAGVSGWSGCSRKWGCPTACARWSLLAGPRRRRRVPRRQPGRVHSRARRWRHHRWSNRSVIMEYLLGRHGPTPLAPEPRDPVLRGLHSSSCTSGRPASPGRSTPSSPAISSRPRTSATNWTNGWALRTFESRRGIVARQLARVALPCRRALHRGRHFGDLRARVRPADRQCRAQRGRARLGGAHRRARGLRPGDGHVPGDQGLGGRDGCRWVE